MSTKTKTFEECCDEVAIENGFESHLDYLKESIIPLFKEAAELYTTEKIKRAIELARETTNGFPKLERQYDGLKYTPDEIMQKLNEPEK